MSAGHAHSRPNEKHPVELAKIEAEPGFQQMWGRPFKVTVTRQVPDSAGYSVAGDEYFVDSDLYRAILAGSWTDPRTGHVHDMRVPGLIPMQVIQCLLTHERTEKCILDASRDKYQGAHEFATLAEHTKVKAFGGRPVTYERTLAPMILWNQVKPLTKVPLNLSCEPLRDDPDAQDKITLKVLAALGVADASQTEKASGQAQQRPPGLQGGGGQDRPGAGDPQPGGSPGGGQPQGQPGGPQGQPAPQQGEGVI